MADKPGPEPEWSDTPPEILETIAQFLKTYSDYIRLRAVCRTWRSFLPTFPFHHLPCQLPWLLLTPPPPPAIFCGNNISNRRHAFYDLLTGKTHSLRLPEASYPRRVVGSSHGYLVLVGESPDIFCYNPLTKSKVFLAPISTLPGIISFSFSNVGREYSIRDGLSEDVYTLDLRQMRDLFIRKVVLSTSPTKEEFVALAIISSSIIASTELVIYKSGESRWRSVPVARFSVEDVIYSQSDGLVYAVNEVGDVAVLSITNDVQIIKSVNKIDGDLRYLVNFEGDLLLVSRWLGTEVDIVEYREVYQTIRFAVYRFHETGDANVSWEAVTELGDQIVFVGDNSSLALSASDFPGCKGNCIYFTDDHSKSNDVGIYDLMNGTIEPFPCYPQDVSSPLRCSPPIWFTPNPC